MRGSKARALRRLACITAHASMDHPGKVIRDTQMYQLMQGRRTRVGFGSGTPFNYIIHKPGTARAIYRRLKDDSKPN